MNKSLHVCLERGLPFTPPSPQLKCTTTAPPWQHPLVGLNKHSASISECQWVPFFLHGGIRFHPFAPYTLPCQTPLSDCPSAACCHTATKCNRTLVGRFSSYCHTTSSHLWHYGPTSQTRRHYIQSIKSVWIANTVNWRSDGKLQKVTVEHWSLVCALVWGLLWM